MGDGICSRARKGFGWAIAYIPTSCLQPEQLHLHFPYQSIAGWPRMTTSRPHASRRWHRLQPQDHGDFVRRSHNCIWHGSTLGSSRVLHVAYYQFGMASRDNRPYTTRLRDDNVCCNLWHVRLQRYGPQPQVIVSYITYEPKLHHVHTDHLVDVRWWRIRDTE